MTYAIGLLLLLLLFNLPSWWVRYVMRKHSADIESMPGTGAELAQHLIDRFALAGVTVKQGGAHDNYYDPENNSICLSPLVFNGKSLTAVAIAAHEVGHAIQFTNNEPISKLRTQYLSKAFSIKRIGIALTSVLSLAAIVIKAPQFLLLTAAIAILTMLASVAMYLAILPEEWDASFNKALPLLKSGYLDDKHLPAVTEILKAAAYTYVAGALAEVLNLWRWLRIMR
ncbi:MAG: zinc metallopeptidase [Pseudomonadota bacterium]